MITKRNHWLSLGLAVAILLTAGVTQAQPRGGAAGSGPPGGFGPGFGLLHGPMAERLELTDAQRDQIHEILDAQRTAVAPWHEDMATLDGALEQAIDAEPFDEEAVRAVARQLADVRVELAVARARTAQEIRAVLTPEQRETLGEMRAERRGPRGGFGGRGAPRHHRRGPGG